MTFQNGYLKNVAASMHWLDALSTLGVLISLETVFFVTWIFSSEGMAVKHYYSSRL